MKHTLFALLFIMIVTLVFAACAQENNDAPDNDVQNENTANENTSNEANENNEDDVKQEEVTIRVAYGDWEDEFNEDFKEPIEEALPHITLEYYPVGLNRDEIEEVISRGDLPDIFYVSGADMVDVLEDHELAIDLFPLIDAHDFDMSNIEPALIDSYVAHSAHQELKALPFVRRWDALYYNKNVFDDFGEAYPTDHMTWNEVIDLATNVTGQIDGVDYRGLEVEHFNPMLDQRNIQLVDPNTHEPLYADNDEMMQVFELIDRITSIPGNVPDDLDEMGWGSFIDYQNVAMVSLFDVHIWFSNLEQETGLNWDIVTYPTWEDAPGVGPYAGGAGLAITTTSDHPDEAFEVLSHVLSEEWQLERSKKGFATPLTDGEIQAAFSSEVDGLEEKNLQAIFELEPASMPEQISPYEGVANVLDIREFILFEGDITSYLREQQDEAQAIIENEQQIR